MKTPTVFDALRSVVLVFGVCLLNVSCSDSTGLFCIQIGCDSGLSIQLTSPLTEYRMTIRGVGPKPLHIDCVQDPSCANGVFILDYFPSHVDVTVTAGEEEYRLTNHWPEYEDVYANGQGCGVTCRNGTISVRIDR